MGRATRKDTSRTVSLLDVPPAPPGQRATPEQQGEMLRKALGLDTEDGQRAVRELSQCLGQLQKSEEWQQRSQLQKVFKRGMRFQPLVPIFQTQISPQFLTSLKRREQRQQKLERLLIERLERREAPTAASHVEKLSGKEWISVAFKRRPDELRALSITEAGRKLAEESKSAPDCKPMSAGHCTNELRKLNAWKLKPRNSPKQRPK